MATNVYIDGFNLYYGCLKGSKYKWLDIHALSQELLPNDSIKRIRYFTAKISSRDDVRAPQRQQTYLRALETIPGLTVHLGHFLTSTPRMRLAEPPAKGPASVVVSKTEEKGSDVNLATYMLVDAFRNDADSFVVITNDSDFCEPLRIIRKELGKKVGVINPHATRKRSVALTGSFFKQVRPNALEKCQFPEVIIDANGRKIRKPKDWQ